FSFSTASTIAGTSARRSARRSASTDPVIKGPDASELSLTVTRSSGESSNGADSASSGVPPAPLLQAPRPIVETARTSATLTWQTLRIFITTRVFPQAPALTARESAEKLHPGNQFDAWIRGSGANDLPGSWRPLGGGGGSLARKCRPCYRIRKASKDCGRRLKPA